MIVLHGWKCPTCGAFNGSEKETRDECRACPFRLSAMPSDYRKVKLFLDSIALSVPTLLEKLAEGEFEKQENIEEINDLFDDLEADLKKARWHWERLET